MHSNLLTKCKWWKLPNAVDTTTIRLRFDGRSTPIRLFIKGH